jgi:hypothetical protein
MCDRVRALPVLVPRTVGPDATVSTAADAALVDSGERSIVWWRVYNSVLKTEKTAIEAHLVRLNKVRASASANPCVCARACA